MTERTCSTPGCPRTAFARQSCRFHYQRAYRAQQLDSLPGQMSLEQRFWAKVDKSGDCWLWTAAICQTGGYGRVKVDGKMLKAHRVAYELTIGPIPDGLTLDHLCRVRRCVNPAHLDPCTMGENTSRGTTWLVHRSKTHCPHGHPYSGENLRVDKQGYRHCRTCARDQYARRSA